MNEELLKLYTALQPFFRERMGEWQVGDRWKYPATDDIYTFDGCVSSVPDCAIRIPLTIDDSSPEAQARSLWGMCRDIICLNNNGEDNFEVCILLDDGRGEIWNERSHKGATPTEALLRALCAQEGVEV